MDNLQKTAYCGIYCPDCIHYRNKHSEMALNLKSELDDREFKKYASIKGPFNEKFRKFDDFMEILDALIDFKCDNPCRPGGGCSGKPCKIMECCLSKDYQGCWECRDYKNCEKFDFLEPACGNMPKNNIGIIKENGIETWGELRDAFYIWQR